MKKSFIKSNLFAEIWFLLIASKQFNKMKTILTAHFLFYFILLPVLSSAQLVTISGNVTNSKSGEALQNVSIFESASNTGTITNQSGFFKLVISGGELKFSFTDKNFETYVKEIELKNDTTFSIKLKPKVQVKNQHKKETYLQASANNSKRKFNRRAKK